MDILNRKARRKPKSYAARIKFEDRVAIAKFIVNNQHVSHKQRARLLGISYILEYRIYKELILETKVLSLREGLDPYMPVGPSPLPRYLQKK